MLPATTNRRLKKQNKRSAFSTNASSLTLSLCLDFCPRCLMSLAHSARFPLQIVYNFLLLHRASKPPPTLSVINNHALLSACVSIWGNVARGGSYIVPFCPFPFTFSFLLSSFFFCLSWSFLATCWMVKCLFVVKVFCSYKLWELALLLSFL